VPYRSFVQLDAVLFDVDDTLCRYRRSGSELLAAAFERTGLDPFITVEEYHARYPAFVDESDSMTDLRERCFAAIAADEGRDPSEGVRVAEAYAAERDHGNVEPTPGLEAAISSLSERPGVSLGVVTNGAPEMQSRKLEALGLDGAFGTVVYAGYDAAAKPAPEPFEMALSALDARPERTFHVGNSLDADVAGAHAAGVRSVWIPDDGESSIEHPDPVPDHTVPTLGEVSSLLE
jgi:putative hydrolase of the HAD superfamily